VTRVRVTQVRGLARTTAAHRGTIRALGLGRIRQSAVHEDSPALRGMLRKVSSLVVVEEVSDR
jgi:large subunit ribosomal protein L30